MRDRYSDCFFACLPSGRAVYSTYPGNIPLDDTFKDTRVAAGINWSQPIARLYTGTAGLSFSSEYDYTHAGVNLGLSRDFKQRNTTVSTGVSYSQIGLIQSAARRFRSRGCC
ncbi:MAG TPA: DUF3570 domain-containing protein [Steroidobacteraceae bacterium]|nr:DUF3570 domain-containing protein [Steroidobacteraceae bacterium]